MHRPGERLFAQLPRNVKLNIWEVTLLAGNIVKLQCTPDNPDIPIDFKPATLEPPATVLFTRNARPISRNVIIKGLIPDGIQVGYHMQFDYRRDLPYLPQLLVMKV